MTGVHCVYSDIVSKIAKLIYGRWWSVADLEKLRRDVGWFNHGVVNMFLLVFTSRRFTPHFCLLDHQIKDISWPGSIHALDAPPY